MEKLRKQWNDLNVEMIKDDKYQFLTSTNYSMFYILNNYIKGSSNEMILDVGAGALAFKKFLKTKFKRYISCDLNYKEKILIDFTANAINLPLKPESIDNILLSAVLEHTPEPVDILIEIHRVLKINGSLIITVPHIHHIHDEPNDFYRFTNYGIKYLLEKSNFQVNSIEPVGGGLSFLSTIISGLLLSLFSNFFGIQKICLFINKLFVLITYKIDRILDKNKKLALGYIVFAEKK
ncbi:type 11 methyltransferase [Candidatus Magnetomorum sp. HK-1]|nr:type 11 methyltransferase [Candidatus Magnetomorum sp. HK-1]